jgi:hypothetical protein
VVPLTLPLSGQILAVQILLDRVPLACPRRQAMPYQDGVWGLNPPVDLIIPVTRCTCRFLMGFCLCTGEQGLEHWRRSIGSAAPSAWKYFPVSLVPLLELQSPFAATFSL